MPANSVSIIRCCTAGAPANPNGVLNYLHKSSSAIKAKHLPLFTCPGICQYAFNELNVKKYLLPCLELAARVVTGKQVPWLLD